MPQPDDWTKPGAFEVADGVFRLPLPLPRDGLRSVNVYAIEDGATLALIDAGWALEESRRQLEAALRGIDRSVSEVARCLVTHVHRDHYSQAIAIRREFGAVVSLGSGERPSLEAVNVPNARGLAAQFTQLERCGAQPVLRRLREAGYGSALRTENLEFPDVWLDGCTVTVGARELQVIPTPGHTRGHVVFAHVADGLLFAGDHVLPHITPSIGFEPAPAPLPLDDYLRSLREIRRLPDMQLLPAHGPVTPGYHARVDELLAHHEDRLAACLSAVETGGITAYDVARALPWTRRARRLDDLDPFNQMLATAETEAHLEVLLHRGLLERSDADVTKRFAVAG